MYNFFGYFLGVERQDSVDTVIAVKHTVYAIAWLAVNQIVSMILQGTLLILTVS